MSTPVSIPSPLVGQGSNKKTATAQQHHVRTDSEQQRDIQEQLTLMLDLQYSQMNNVIPRPAATDTATTSEVPDDVVSSSSKSKSKLSSSTESPHHKKPTTTAAVPSPSNQSGVGIGTLYFSNNLKNQNQNDTRKNPPLGQIYTTYGAVAQTTQTSSPPPQQPQLEYSQQIIHQEHDYHYGNPDFHDPYDPINLRGQASSYNNKPWYYRCCCCCLVQPTISLISQEHLQRSFCYGALDGLLTGSGIAAACVGLLSGISGSVSTATWTLRLGVVLLTAAACGADAVCMALGHMWTNHVVAVGHSHEHTQALLRLTHPQDRAEAKATLVDMLLAKGMLKIDAMSLADTLEGYPDLFVRTILGDSLLNGDELNSNSSPQRPLKDESETETDNDSGVEFTDATPSTQHQRHGGAAAGLNDLDDHDQHPWAVLAESRKEGLFMLLGFATFAILPSLLWLWFPLLLPADEDEDTSSLLPTLLIFIFIAIIMWILGVWKSHYYFHHHNKYWLLFGLETVLVLMVCVGVSYSVGHGLSSYFFGSHKKGDDHIQQWLLQHVLLKE